MEDVLSTIRAALTPDASVEVKASGANACRTILAALEAEIGKPIALPGVPSPSPLSGLTLDQMIEVVIPSLRKFLDERDQQRNALPAPHHMPPPHPAHHGPYAAPPLQIPYAAAPRPMPREARPPVGPRPVVRKR